MLLSRLLIFIYGQLKIVITTQHLNTSKTLKKLLECVWPTVGLRITRSSNTFKKDEYSFIICSQVLHFFPDNEKLELIEKFYQSLQSGGLMFLRMAHCDDPFNKTLIQTEHCVFVALPKEGCGPPMPRYTIEPGKFVQSLASYTILDQYKRTTDRSFYFVIEKV